MELRELQLLWGGLLLQGNATLAFDRALQPLFAGSFAIRLAINSRPCSAGSRSIVVRKSANSFA